MGTRPLYTAREHFNSAPAIDALAVVRFVSAARRSGIAGAGEIRTFGGFSGGRFRPSPEVERLLEAAEAEVRGAEPMPTQKPTPTPTTADAALRQHVTNRLFAFRLES